MPARTVAGMSGGTWLRDFHPGWFGAVMGTAVIGVIASGNPGHFHGLATTMKDLSIGATALAADLGVLIAVPYLARWILHPGAAWADMREPTVGPLHGTFPGGILVLAVAISTVGPQVLPVHSVPTVVEVLAAIGIPLALAISLLFAYLLFTLELPDTRVVNGGWFIPPVVTIIVPVVLVPLVSQVGPSAARLLLFTGYAFWGVGFLLFLLVMGLLHDRLVTRALPAAAMAPSLWIVLGPLGVGAAGLLDLGRAAPTVLGPGAAVIGTLSLVGASALVGVRGLVAAGRHEPARPLLAPGRRPLRGGLVGVHLPSRRAHLGHLIAGERLEASDRERHRPRPAHWPRGALVDRDRRDRRFCGDRRRLGSVLGPGADLAGHHSAIRSGFGFAPHQSP
jgi:tellurite resistance protein TehA-like permease